MFATLQGKRNISETPLHVMFLTQEIRRARLPASLARSRSGYAEYMCVGCPLGHGRFYRDVGMRGWTGGLDGTKMLVFEADMPRCTSEACSYDRPAVWALNAQVLQPSHLASRLSQLIAVEQDNVKCDEVQRSDHAK